jgi:hypothetical protein
MAIRGAGDDACSLYATASFGELCHRSTEAAFYRVMMCKPLSFVG